MTFNEKQLAELKSPLLSGNVKQREQAGRKLSYIEGWHAIAEANRIFGFAEWNRELSTIRQLGEPREVDGKWRVAYMATVRVTVFAGETTIVRDGTGYGSGIDRDVGSAHESALKEAETDAMKRALMTFGNPFGLALYDKTQANVAAEPPPPSVVDELVAHIKSRPTVEALEKLQGKPGFNERYATLSAADKDAVMRAAAAQRALIESGAPRLMAG